MTSAFIKTTPQDEAFDDIQHIDTPEPAGRIRRTVPIAPGLRIGIEGPPATAFWRGQTVIITGGALFALVWLRAIPARLWLSGQDTGDWQHDQAQREYRETLSDARIFGALLGFAIGGAAGIAFGLWIAVQP